MNVLQIDGMQLKHVLPHFRSDFDVVMTAVKQNYMAISFASEKLKANADIALTVLKRYYYLKHFVNSHSLASPGHHISDVL